MTLPRIDGAGSELDTLPVAHLAVNVAVLTLRSAPQGVVRQDAWETDLRDAIRLMVRAARASGLRPEQLIVLFKHAWSSIPDAPLGVGRTDRTDALSRAVTMCIEEYYADDR